MPPTTEKITKANLSAVVADVLKDSGLVEFKEQIEEMAEKRSGWFDPEHFASRVAPPTDKEADEKRGMVFSQVVRSLAANKGLVQNSAQWAKTVFGDAGESKTTELFEKAMEAGTESSGGFLLTEEVGEFIPLLRPASRVMAAGPRTVDLDGSLRMPRHTAGATGGWIGEGSAITKTQPTIGSIVMTPKKYAALVPISNDLLNRNTSANVDAFVRDDLVRDVSLALDIAYLRGLGAAAEPRGMLYWGTSTAANGTVNVANVLADLVGCIERMGDAGVGMTNLHWFFNWRTWRYLYTLRDGDQWVFKPEMDSGSLLGIPFSRCSQSQIPSDLGGGGDESEIYLAEMDDCIVGEATDVRLDASDTAAYLDGVDMKASFSNDETVVRVVVERDFAVRHAEAVQILTAVTWGA